MKNSRNNTKNRSNTFHLNPGSISYNATMRQKETINQSNISSIIDCGRPITTINNATQSNIGELLAKTAPKAMAKSKRFRHRSRFGGPSLTSRTIIQTCSKTTATTHNSLKTVSHPICTYQASNVNKNSNNKNKQKQNDSNFMEIETQTSVLQSLPLLQNVSVTKSDQSMGCLVPQPSSSPISQASSESTKTNVGWTADEKEWFDNNREVLKKCLEDEKEHSKNANKSKTDKFLPSVCL